MRRFFVLLSLVLSLEDAPTPAAEAVARLAADIDAGPVATALSTFGQQTGLQLIYVSAVTDSLQSKGARAGLTASEALEALLAGTGLTFEFLNARTVRVFPSAAIPAAHTTATPAPVHPQHPLAAVEVLDEVVVTANRREQLASETPIDMVVWSEPAMQLANVKDMTQLGQLTPGIDYTFRGGIGGDLYTELTIRGVTNLHSNPTGVFLDDFQIPLGRTLTYGRSIPETFDAERVEILRGPQPVLLGDHTLGGAVRYVLNRPSLSSFSAYAHAEWTTIEGGGPGYEVGAGAGGPLLPGILGFRLSGWDYEQGGYVDRVDPQSGQTLDPNANRYGIKTYKAALTWMPTDSITVSPMLLYQWYRIRDTSTFEPAVSDPPRGIFRNPSQLQQPFGDEFVLASAKLVFRLARSELSSSTSYFDRSASATRTLSLTPDSPLTAVYNSIAQHTFAQELQLSSVSEAGAHSWIVGAFYTHDQSRHPQWEAGTSGDADDIEAEQFGVFGQLVLKPHPRFTAEIGVRIANSRYDARTETPVIVTSSASENWVAPRLSLSLQPATRDLLYLSVTKGHGSAGVYPGSHVTYPADTVWSYEAGNKGALRDGRMQLDVGVFYIQWDNGPPSERYVLGEVDALPGKLRSTGFDLSLRALFDDALTLVLSGAYTDARCTQTLALGGQVYVRAGDKLGTTPWSVTASLERAFRLRDGVGLRLYIQDAFRANPGVSYLNDASLPWYGGPPEPGQSTNLLDARVELQWTHLDVGAFVSNALNWTPAQDSSSVMPFPPRTFALQASWRY